MTNDSRSFSAALPKQVSDAIYTDYPTYRAVITILDRLCELPGLSMNARLAGTGTHIREHPVLDFTIDEGTLFLLRISCPDRIFLRFSTRTDLHRFLDSGKPEGVIFGRRLSANPNGWPMSFEMMAAFHAKQVDYLRAAHALYEVLDTSPTRRTARRPEDTELQALLREYNKPQDEVTYDHLMEGILDRIDESNFDEVMGTLQDYDPMAEEDPTSVPIMRLILMGDLVRERGQLLEQCRKCLPSVRAELEAIGEPARHGVNELDGLMAYIDEKLS